MPVQMLVGGVEIQIRLSGSEAVADGPYSFSSRFALVSTFSPGAIACAAPLMVHTSLKNSDGDCAKTSEVSDRPTKAARMRLIMRTYLLCCTPLLGKGGVRGGSVNIPADLQQSIRKFDRTTPCPSFAKEGNLRSD